MANLKTSEKAKLQKFLEMGQGYVCDFSNNTFSDFVAESIDIDIYRDEYAKENSGSKAARLRAFWDKEPNPVVAKLLDELLDYWKSQLAIDVGGHQPFNPVLYAECKKIVQRLAADHSVQDAGALVPNSTDKDFGLLAKSIKESIDKGEME
jgi:hypothetical protein